MHDVQWFKFPQMAPVHPATIRLTAIKHCPIFAKSQVCGLVAQLEIIYEEINVCAW